MTSSVKHSQSFAEALNELERVELVLSKELLATIQEFFIPRDAIDKLWLSSAAKANDRRRVQAIAIVFSYKLLDIRRWVSCGDSSAVFQKGQGNSLGDERFKLVSIYCKCL